MIAIHWLGLSTLLLSTTATAAQTLVSYEQAVTRSQRAAPAAEVARTTELIAEADSRVAGLYPNPTVQAGTSTQTARLSLGISIPLVVLGQRSAAIRVGKAELEVAKLDTRNTLTDVRASAAHAFVGLWLAEHTARARMEAAEVAARLDGAAQARVELGSAPELDGMRAHAERLRSDLEAQVARANVEAASAELGYWIGAAGDATLRVAGDPGVPARVPPLSELWPGASRNPIVQRALAEARASSERAASERAQLRPLMSLDAGADLYDKTLPGPNYRAQLAVDVPLFNQRGPLIEREERRGDAARSQARAERARLAWLLTAAYRTFSATTIQVELLAQGVLPAARAAAKATEESYTLGRAPLVALLDAERSRIDAELVLVESEATRANAWIDIEHAMGVR